MRNCRACKRWRRLSDYKPYYSNKRSKEYLKQTCEHCVKRRQLERYYNFSPKQKQEMRERTREYAAARRRKEGKPVRNIKKNGYGSGRVKDNIRGMSLDPKPLLSYAKSLGLDWEEIADKADVNIRRVFDWRKGKFKMPIYTADRLCTKLNIHLSLLYPDYE